MPGHHVPGLRDDPHRPLPRGCAGHHRPAVRDLLHQSRRRRDPRAGERLEHRPAGPGGAAAQPVPRRRVADVRRPPGCPVLRTRSLSPVLRRARPLRRDHGGLPAPVRRVAAPAGAGSSPSGSSASSRPSPSNGRTRSRSGRAARPARSGGRRSSGRERHWTTTRTGMGRPSSAAASTTGPRSPPPSSSGNGLISARTVSSASSPATPPRPPGCTGSVAAATTCSVAGSTGTRCLRPDRSSPAGYWPAAAAPSSTRRRSASTADSPGSRTKGRVILPRSSSPRTAVGRSPTAGPPHRGTDPTTWSCSSARWPSSLVAGDPLTTDLVADDGISAYLRQLVRWTRGAASLTLMRGWFDELESALGEPVLEPAAPSDIDGRRRRIRLHQRHPRHVDALGHGASRPDQRPTR